MRVQDLPRRLVDSGFASIENPKLKKSKNAARRKQAAEDAKVRKAAEARVGHIMIYHICDKNEADFIESLSALGVKIPEKCYKHERVVKWDSSGRKTSSFRSTDELLCNKATVVVLKGHKPKKDSKGGISVGVAFCSKKEQYSRKKGTNIAMHRAVQKLAEIERKRLQKQQLETTLIKKQRKISVSV